MNLSAKLVIYHLKKHFDVDVSGHLTSEPNLRYPVIYNKDRNIRDGLIYVIDDPSILPKSHTLKNILYILVGGDPSVSLQHYSNICRVPGNISTAWILQVLQEIFQIYNEWQENIFHHMFDSPTVQNLLEISFPAISNPMSVMGMDFHCIGAYQTDHDEMLNEFLGSTDETMLVLNALKTDLNYQKAYDQEGYFYFPGNEYSAPSLCVNIRMHGYTQYRLLIHPGAMPLDDTIGYLAEFLAQNITQILLLSPHSSVTGPLSLQSIFHELMTNSKADYVKISQSLTAAGWQVSHLYQCILFTMSVQDLQHQTFRSICSYMENQIPHSCAMEHRGSVVLFINLTLCPLPYEEIHQKLAYYIRESMLRAGFSRTMMGHFNFYRQYQQAKITLELGSHLHPDFWLHDFNDIALPYLANQMTRKLPAYMVAHDRLLQLKNMQDMNESHLYETLHCYLQHNQNATRTSQALHIHRSTLLYRLEQIERFLGSNLTQPEEILYLLISFYLIETENNESNNIAGRNDTP